LRPTQNTYVISIRPLTHTYWRNGSLSTRRHGKIKREGAILLSSKHEDLADGARNNGLSGCFLSPTSVDVHTGKIKIISKEVIRNI